MHKVRREQRATAGVAAGSSGKVLIPLLGVSVLLAVGVAGTAITLMRQERQKRQAKERELRLALAENRDLKDRIDDIEQAKSRVEEELGRARKELVESQDRLSEALSAKETLAKSVEDREQEIGRLGKELEQAQSNVKQITKELSDLQTEHDGMKEQVADLEEAKGDLESKLVELSDHPTVELEKVTVGEGQPQPAVSAVPGAAQDGQVVVINHEYDFVVVNLGKKQGLSVGQEFQVVRGETILGKVKVEKVYDELSAAAILPESQKENIREGDTVRAL